MSSGVNLEAAKRVVEPNSDFRVMTLSSAQGWFVSWVTDILVYIIVLNLFDEFFNDHIKIESFWISILTAVLFKLLLVLLGEIEHRVHHQLEEQSKAVVITGVFLVLFFGKLAIIEIINAVFDQVELHGILYEVAMILTMIIASGLIWRIFSMLGTDIDRQAAASSIQKAKAETAAVAEPKRRSSKK